VTAESVMGDTNSENKRAEGKLFDLQMPLLRKIFKQSGVISIVILLVLYLSTCFSQVKVQETGVLLRFGKVVRRHIDPGICLKLPWPFDRLITVRTRSVETIQAGFGEDPEKLEEIERAYGPIEQRSMGTLIVPYILTGDKNILHLKVLVNYSVNDPVQYVFGVNEPAKLLGLMIQQVILDCVSRTRVDQLLTSGRIELRDIVNRNLAELMEHVDLGIHVLSVEIRNVRPPRTTTQAFKDVINAQEESREIVHQAESYTKRMLPEAQAEALQTVSQAQAYANTVIESARGEVGRFELVAAEYTKYPHVTRERLRQDTVAQVYPLMSKYVMAVSRDGKLPANFRFLTEPQNAPSEAAPQP
jgi:modulator of FtsH protease HflK